MLVTVLAFAQARDQLGWSERTIECTAGETPRTVLARLAPALCVDAMRAAVDQEYRGWDEPLGPAQELALIPPVSGG